MKILFLDIDGPMIPGRFYFHPRNHGRFVEHFDPSAVAMVNRLLYFAPARLVISSTWRQHGLTRMTALLDRNGIDPAWLHDEWGTPLRPQTRKAEIKAWLKKHPETTHYAALDDEWVGLPGAVKMTFEDGMSTRHYTQAGRLLNISEDDLMVGKLPDSPRPPKLQPASLENAG